MVYVNDYLELPLSIGAKRPANAEDSAQWYQG